MRMIDRCENEDQRIPKFQQLTNDISVAFDKRKSERRAKDGMNKLDDIKNDENQAMSKIMVNMSIQTSQPWSSSYSSLESSCSCSCNCNDDELCEHCKFEEGDNSISSLICSSNNHQETAHPIEDVTVKDSTAVWDKSLQNVTNIANNKSNIKKSGFSKTLNISLKNQSEIRRSIFLRNQSRLNNIVDPVSSTPHLNRSKNASKSNLQSPSNISNISPINGQLMDEVNSSDDDNNQNLTFQLQPLKNETNNQLISNLDTKTLKDTVLEQETELSVESSAVDKCSDLSSTNCGFVHEHTDSDNVDSTASKNSKSVNNDLPRRSFRKSKLEVIKNFATKSIVIPGSTHKVSSEKQSFVKKLENDNPLVDYDSVIFSVPLDEKIDLPKWKMSYQDTTSFNDADPESSISENARCDTNNTIVEERLPLVNYDSVVSSVPVEKSISLIKSTSDKSTLSTNSTGVDFSFGVAGFHNPNATGSNLLSPGKISQVYQNYLDERENYFNPNFTIPFDRQEKLKKNVLVEFDEEKEERMQQEQQTNDKPINHSTINQNDVVENNLTQQNNDVDKEILTQTHDENKNIQAEASMNTEIVKSHQAQIVGEDPAQTAKDDVNEVHTDSGVHSNTAIFSMEQTESISHVLKWKSKEEDNIDSQSTDLYVDSSKSNQEDNIDCDAVRDNMNEKAVEISQKGEKTINNIAENQIEVDVGNVSNSDSLTEDKESVDFIVNQPLVDQKHFKEPSSESVITLQKSRTTRQSLLRKPSLPCIREDSNSLSTTNSSKSKIKKKSKKRRRKLCMPKNRYRVADKYYAPKRDEGKRSIILPAQMLLPPLSNLRKTSQVEVEKKQINNIDQVVNNTQINIENCNMEELEHQLSNCFECSENIKEIISSPDHSQADTPIDRLLCKTCICNLEKRDKRTVFEQSIRQRLSIAVMPFRENISQLPSPKTNNLPLKLTNNLSLKRKFDNTFSNNKDTSEKSPKTQKLEQPTPKHDIFKESDKKKSKKTNPRLEKPKSKPNIVSKKSKVEVCTISKNTSKSKEHNQATPNNESPEHALCEKEPQVRSMSNLSNKTKPKRGRPRRKIAAMDNANEAKNHANNKYLKTPETLPRYVELRRSTRLTTKNEEVSGSRKENSKTDKKIVSKQLTKGKSVRNVQSMPAKKVDLKQTEKSYKPPSEKIKQNNEFKRESKRKEESHKSPAPKKQKTDVRKDSKSKTLKSGKSKKQTTRTKSQTTSQKEQPQKRRETNSKAKPKSAIQEEEINQRASGSVLKAKVADSHDQENTTKKHKAVNRQITPPVKQSKLQSQVTSTKGKQNKNIQNVRSKVNTRSTQKKKQQQNQVAEQWQDKFIDAIGTRTRSAQKKSRNEFAAPKPLKNFTNLIPPRREATSETSFSSTFNVTRLSSETTASFMKRRKALFNERENFLNVSPLNKKQMNSTVNDRNKSGDRSARPLPDLSAVQQTSFRKLPKDSISGITNAKFGLPKQYNQNLFKKLNIVKNN